MQTEIAGFGTISVGKCAPLRGLVVKAHIVKTLGPLLTSAAPLFKELPDVQGETFSLADVDVAKLAPVMTALAEHLDPEKLPVFAEAVLQTASVVIGEGKHKVQVDLCDEGAIDRVFSGHSDLVFFQAIWFATRAHWSNFSGGSASGATALPTPTL